MRIGHGYDVHRLETGRKLTLGGVDIPFEEGLLGHSDADVLVHAVIDAIFGAMAVGDIGQHFPDSDPQYKDVSSIWLLQQAIREMEQNGFSISNIDCTIVAERPKLAPYIGEMKKNLAQACHLDVSCVGIKATTEEGLGLSGKGIGAHCVCILQGGSTGFFAFVS